MVMRVNKNKNYTVMSNEHLRDTGLSWKARGMLSTFLSLPDNWDYSTAGLEQLVPDGNVSTRSGLKELESAGYLKRTAVRKNGKIVDWQYDIYETKWQNPEYAAKNADSDESAPHVQNKHVANVAQLNTKELNTKERNTNISVQTESSPADADSKGSIPAESNRRKEQTPDGVNCLASKGEDCSLYQPSSRKALREEQTKFRFVKSLSKYDRDALTKEAAVAVVKADVQFVLATYDGGKVKQSLGFYEALDFWLDNAAYRESARKAYISKFVEGWQRVLDYHKNDFYAPARGAHGVMWKNVLGKYAENWNLGSKTELEALKKQNIPAMEWE